MKEGVGETRESTQRGHRRVVARRGEGNTKGRKDHRDDTLEDSVTDVKRVGNLGRVPRRTRFGPKILSQSLRVINDGGRRGVRACVCVGGGGEKNNAAVWTGVGGTLGDQEGRWRFPRPVPGQCESRGQMPGV